MATREMIETLLAEAAGMTVRTFTPAQIEDVAGAFARAWGGIDDKALASAFDAWLTAQGEKPPQALPTPKAILAFRRRAQQRQASPAPRGGYKRPTPEFVAGQLAIRGIVREISTAATIRHVHLLPTFNPETMEPLTTGREKCRACTASETRRARILEAVEEIPEPETEDSPRPCKCDGSGWVDTKLSMTYRESPTWIGHREVYPCVTCRPELFHAWRRDEIGTSPEAA